MARAKALTPMPTYVELNSFAALAEQRRISRAAMSLGVSKSAISHSVQALEKRLAVKLFERTPRGFELTSAGGQLLVELKPVLERYAEAIEAIEPVREKPAGVLRLLVSPAINFSIMEEILSAFVIENPDMTIEVASDPFSRDVVAERFDAGIAPRELIPQDMVAIRVSGEMRTMIAGSPAYFARFSEPKAPRDLRAHNCIRHRRPDGTIFPWRVIEGGRVSEMAVQGSIIVDNRELAVSAALGGAGIIWSGEAFLARFIAEGRLVPVLVESTEHSDGLFLYYSSRRQIPQPLQALINLVRTRRLRT